MKKVDEKTLEMANKILLVVILLFAFLSVYIWITTATPWKTANAGKGDQEENVADLELANGMETGFDDQVERQTFPAVKGFKVSAKNTTDSRQSNTYEENTADTNEFAFPNSYKERLTNEDVRSLTTKKEVQDAINYIYARTGCMFRDEERKAYYEQFDWYEGSYFVDEMNDNPLNYMTEIQHDNIDLLAQRRNELNE
jgi:hypothetical protein